MDEQYLPDDYQGGGSESKLQELVNSAFTKGLVAAILMEVPFASIVSIFLGIAAGKTVKKADELASRLGTKAGGKRLAAKILSKVGLFGGIAMSVFWVCYMLYIIIFMVIWVQLQMISPGYIYY